MVVNIMDYVTFWGPGGLLEGFVLMPIGASDCPGIVVCHPDPRFRGDMHNQLVISICEELAREGLASLRFNFRGVGKSRVPHTEGEYGERTPGAYMYGVGDVDDTMAALRFISTYQSVSESRLGVVGGSFGAKVALKASLVADDVKGMALIGRMLVGDEVAIPKRESLETLFILGAEDKFTDSYKRILSNNLVKNVTVIDGCDQFFVDSEYVVGEIVASFLNQAL